jgi:hypothetical protein
LAKRRIGEFGEFGAITGMPPDLGSLRYNLISFKLLGAAKERRKMALADSG